MWLGEIFLNAALVGKGKALPSLRELLLSFLDKSVQLLDSLDPLGQNVTPELDELFVPVVEFLLLGCPFADLSEQRIALAEHAVVTRKRAAIEGIDLAEGDVEIASAFGGRACNEVDILGKKEDDVQLADDIKRAARKAIEAELPAKADLTEAVGGALLNEDGLDRVLFTSPHKGYGGMGVGNDLCLGCPVDELLVAGGTGRFGGGEIVDGLQQVCFSLGVGSLEEMNTRRKVELQARIVAKVGQ